MKLQSLLVIVVVFFLQACAVGPKRTLLPQADRTNIKSLELYNLIIQDEVKPAIELSNVTGAMGGGLIAAMIDSSVNKGRSATSQDIIEPLYNVTDSVDYRKLLAQEVNASVSSIYTLKAKKDLAESVLLSDPELKKKVMSLAEGEYLLNLSSFYGMMENSKSLNVEAVAMVFKRPIGKGNVDLSKPIYYNRFNYVSDVVGTGANNSISAWSKDEGALFVKALSESAKEIAQQLKYDLQNSVVLECGNPVTMSIIGFNGVRYNAKGVLVEQKQSRAMVRGSDNGALYSVPGTPLSSAKNKNSKCQ